MSERHSSNGKALRFAALVRVSTEAQERQGESLRTQRAKNERDVARLGGRIVGWYGGQEHATPGRERKEVDRLIADSAKVKFDAVIVSDADRWSRDNAKSKEGLDTLRKAGVRFFVGSLEMDLFNPQHRFILGMNAEVGEFIALQQTKKSIDVRIDNAKEGRPSGGRVPFGRTWSKEKGWGLDPAKKAMIEDVARRYLAGESLPKLAEEYQVNHSQLCLTLRERCGEDWAQEFHCDNLNVHERVVTKVPRLLDEKTVKAVRQRLEANRTYRHRPPQNRKVNDYLLSGFMFCGACGYSLCGQTDKHGVRHYNHSWARRERECPLRPRPWISAGRFEADVGGELFDMFGNPAAVKRAFRAAAPDRSEERKRANRVEAALAKVAKQRGNLVDAVADGTLTREEVRQKKADLEADEARLREELDQVHTTLEGQPDEDQLAAYLEWFDATHFHLIDGNQIDNGNGGGVTGGNDFGTLTCMSWQDRRHLIEAVFSKSVGGKPSGIYVVPNGENRPYARKTWKYVLRGLLPFERVVLSHVPPDKVYMPCGSY
jgi:site-specific DNA recombinase